MRYFVVIEGSYIIGVGKGERGEQITEQRYNDILAAIRAKPDVQGTTDYHLKTDLTWEAYELPPMPDPQEDDLNADELLSILLGGGAV